MMNQRNDVRCFNCGRLLFKMLPNKKGSRGGVVHVQSGTYFPTDPYEVPLNIHVIGRFEIKCSRCKSLNKIESRIKISKEYFDGQYLRLPGFLLEKSYEFFEKLIKESFLVNVSALERQTAQGAPKTE